MPSVYVAKALQVMTEDSRLNIVSRRVSVGKGGHEGGGGGADPGAAADMRRDFRVLAFWLGSVPTDAAGRATAEVTLPESLTTYRIMAVAGDRASRFGFAEREIRTSKPVLLKPAFPRFLAVGDTARFGSVVHSLLPEKGSAIVTMRSLDPGILEIAGNARRTVEVPAKGAAEVRFDLRAKAVGRARIQMTAKLRGETDAFEDVIPVEILVSPETVAAYGRTDDEARETLEIAAGIVPGFGGLHVETASTALVGLGEGARYLVEYPYGCAEQRASATLALALAADLGDAFRLANVDAAESKRAAAAAYRELDGVPVPERGLRLLEGPVRVGVALPDELGAARDGARARPRLPGGRRGRGPGPRVPREAARRRRAAGRRVVARLHRVADLRGEGAGRGRQAAGQPRDPPLRPPRPDAGLRHDLPAGRDGGGGREGRAAGGAGAPDPERDPARGRVGARRGAVRPAPAVVLELERALDRARPRHAGAQRSRRSAGAGARALAARGAQGRALGRHAGERDGARGARRLLPRSTSRRRPTSAPWSSWEGRRWPSSNSAGGPRRRR